MAQAGIIKEAHEFWERTSPSEYQILLLMASSEDKTDDVSGEVATLLKQLDQSFELAGGVDFDHSLNTIKILGSLSVVLEFYLVRRYDMAYPGASADILGLANSCLKDSEYGTYAAVLLRRHVVFERMKIMRRVFAPERLVVVTDFAKENAQNYQR